MYATPVYYIPYLLHVGIKKKILPLPGSVAGSGLLQTALIKIDSQYTSSTGHRTRNRETRHAGRDIQRHKDTQEPLHSSYYCFASVVKRLPSNATVHEVGSRLRIPRGSDC